MPEKSIVHGHWWNNWIWVATRVAYVWGGIDKASAEYLQRYRAWFLYELVYGTYANKRTGVEELGRVGEIPYTAEFMKTLSESDQERAQQLHELVVQANNLLSQIREATRNDPVVDWKLGDDDPYPNKTIPFQPDSPVLDLIAKLKDVCSKARELLTDRECEFFKNHLPPK